MNDESNFQLRGTPRDICPSAVKDKDLYVRVLHDACVKLGGEHALAEYLGLDVAVIHVWLKGRRRPPEAVFLKCLDLLESG
jgi:hypothetical protein